MADYIKLHGNTVVDSNTDSYFRNSQVTGTISVGNSTVNAVINSTSLTSSTITVGSANVTGVLNFGSISSLGNVVVGNTQINGTLNVPTITVGNVSGNNATFGNTTISATLTGNYITASGNVMTPVFNAQSSTLLNWGEIEFRKGDGTLGGYIGAGANDHIDISLNTGVNYVNIVGGIPDHSLFVGGKLVWTANNDGSGSGLDADLLDGQDSTYFTNITARLGYTPLNIAGGTMTGKLTMLGSNTTTAGFSLGASGTQPTSPVTGDLWYAGPGLQYYNGSATRTVYDNSNLTTFVADTGLGPGTKGLVPAPAQGDANANKYLSATGSFVFPGSTANSDIWTNASAVIPSVNLLWTSQAFVSIPYVSSVAPNFNTLINATITLTGNFNLASPTNPKAGQSGLIKIVQDAVGGRTVTFGPMWKFAGGTPTASTTANAVDVIAYTYDGTNLLCSYLKAFA